MDKHRKLREPRRSGGASATASAKRKLGDLSRHVREPPAAGEGKNKMGSREKAKFSHKLLGKHSHVDPALVPRKLRSAIKKNSSKSLSPHLSVAKKSNWQTSYLNGIRLKNNMFDKISKDEAEVAEALSSLASVVLSSEPVEIREDSIMFHANSNAEAPATSKVVEVEDKEAMNTCDVVEEIRLSSSVEPLEEDTKKEASASERVITHSKTQMVNQEPEKSSQIQSITACVGIENHALTSHNLKIWDPLRTCSEVTPIIGQELEKLYSCPITKIELELQPLDLSGIKYELRQDKHKSVGDLFTSKEGDPKTVFSHPHGNLGMIHSGKHTPWAATFASAVRSENGQKTEQLPVVSGDRSRPWGNCLTHAYISHLTQSYQYLRKEGRFHLSNGLKGKDIDGVREIAKGAIGQTNGFYGTIFAGLKGRNRSGVKRAKGIIGRTNSVDSTSFSRVNLQEEGIQKLHGIPFPAPQISRQPESFTQLNQTCNNFLAFCSNAETSNPSKEINSSGHLNVPYMHPQVHHHAGIPFSFLQDCYTSPYTDVVPVTVNKQLQLPPYLGCHYYQQYLSDGGATCIPQHPHMWPLPMAYNIPHMGMTSWTPGAVEDPCSLPSTNARVEVIGNSTAYCHPHPQLQQKQSLTPFQSSPSLQPHQSNVPIQLQLICGASQL